MSLPLVLPNDLPLAGPAGAALTKGVGVSYEAEATALFARFTTPATAARKALINDFWKTTGIKAIMAKCDAFYMLAAETSQAGRQNWVADQFNLTAVSSPAFVVDRGYTGDGAASYLSTGFNPTSGSPKYAVNNGHLGIWSRTDLDNGGDSYDFGGTARAYLSRAAAASGTMKGRIHTATKTLATGVYPGHGVVSRTGAAVWEGYAQGVDAGGGTDADTGIGNETWRILSASAVLFGANQIAACHFGSGLSAGETLALYNATRTYLQAVGAA